MPPMSKKRLAEIENFVNTDFSDCPILTKEQLSKAKRLRDVHPEWFKPAKQDVHIKIDIDILETLKAQGRGYQTKINAILRKAIFG